MPMDFGFTKYVSFVDSVFFFRLINLLLRQMGDYVYVRRRKTHGRPTQPAEWSNWVCGRVVESHMCGHSKDCVRLVSFLYPGLGTNVLNACIGLHMYLGED